MPPLVLARADSGRQGHSGTGLEKKGDGTPKPKEVSCGAHQAGFNADGSAKLLGI